MSKYQIILTLKNDSSVALPEEDFNIAVQAAKALIKLDVVVGVTVLNTKTNDSSTFIV